jgi:hypothetical protein
MQKILALLLLALSAATTAHAGDEGSELAQASEATRAFAHALKTELMSAMQSGGPVAAVEVCQNRAPAIAAELSEQTGIRLGRVSLKNRNPGNAPNDWQRSVLVDFEARRAAGEDPAAMVWHETVSLGQSREFRFMKAIPTAALCLSCHGQDIAEPVAASIAAHYPGDRATGFSEGDIRGAFVATRAIEP